MRSQSSRQRHKWMNGGLALLATVGPIAAYADLVNPWSGRSPREPFANTYVASAPKFVAPFKRSTLANGFRLPKSAATLPSTAVRKSVVTAPSSAPKYRPASRKIPMTLALILMVEAQNQRNTAR